MFLGTVRPAEKADDSENEVSEKYIDKKLIESGKHNQNVADLGNPVNDGGSRGGITSFDDDPGAKSIGRKLGRPRGHVRPDGWRLKPPCPPRLRAQAI